jgi:hypothetical protein
MDLVILGSPLTFSALGGWGKEKKLPAGKFLQSPSEGAAEGGGVGEEFRHARAEAKPRRPARSEQKPAKKFSFLFRRKSRARAKRKCRENFFAGWRASASGGGAERQAFRSK